MIALLVLAACTDKGDSSGRDLEADTDTDSDTDTDTDTDTDSDTDTDFDSIEDIDVHWTSTHVTVTTTGGVGLLDFGMIKVTEHVDWLAESCTDVRSKGFGPFCHSVGAVLTELQLSIFQEDVDDHHPWLGLGPNTDDDTSATTYYFGDPHGTWCVVTGPDTSFYDDHDCKNGDDLISITW